MRVCLWCVRVCGVHIRCVWTCVWGHDVWAHRVFYDRLINQKDQEMFMTILNDKLGAHLSQTVNNICPNSKAPTVGKTRRCRGGWGGGCVLCCIACVRSYREPVAQL
jgi:hypothetical protein